MTLSLCMIVKNEERVLDRALSTAGVYADEIIVVDTGSTDGTKRIAQRYTDKVFDFAWCDDFSAARNYAFSKATCDYRMWLDADDIVPMPSARAIAKLMKTLDPSVDMVMLPYDLGGETGGGLTYYRERIVKNRADMVFRGRVHEAIGLHGNVKRCKPRIFHGKPEDRATGTRNLDIYKKMLSDGVRFEPRERYYYARELFYNGDKTHAAAEFENFLAEPDGFYVNKIDACLMLARCYAATGDRARTLAPLFDSFIYALPTGEVCCEIALVYFSDGDYAQAAFWFERAAHAKPDMRSGAFVDVDCYGFLPFVWLSVCYDRIGKKRTAYHYHCRARKLKPDHPSVIANQAYFESLGYRS